MKFTRAAGILLHPTSLPGPFGIGDLGPSAYRFVDWLAGSGCRLWQVLPLGPTGYGNSPYQCFSAFAGNPYLISPELLVRDGLLSEADLNDRPSFPISRVDFGLLIPWKLSLLERAFQRFRAEPAVLRADFEAFCAENASWLTDYALFMALKESEGDRAWVGWPEPLRRRRPSAIESARRELTVPLSRFSFYQFLFFRQWSALRTYANQKGVQIIGDIPIFVAHDSADVWAHPELFFLDEDGNPTVVAGVPPDFFSPTGQRWGNPLYRWDVHKETSYQWWVDRFRVALRLVDLVRLDHFRGFAGYYEIPAGHPTAEHGRWIPGPASDFFRVLQRSLTQDLPIIAEDLGVITPDVIALRHEFNLPGMKVLQFGFSGPQNPFLPHNYSPHCVVYTGTHDNDTSRGWFEAASPAERDFALRYLRTNENDFVWDLIRAAWASVAVFAIVPMQDLLGLGGEARMNYPGRPDGNWEWRMDEAALAESARERLGELNYLYGRGDGKSW